MLNRTPIMTPTGYKLAKNIRVDDEVLSGQGIIGHVTGVHYIKEYPCVLSFSDGRNMVTSASQKLHLIDTGLISDDNKEVTLVVKDLLTNGISNDVDNYRYCMPLALGSRYSFDSNGVKRQLELFDALKNRGKVVTVDGYTGINYRFLSRNKQEGLAVKARSLGYVVEENINSKLPSMTIYGNKQELSMLILNDKHKLKGISIYPGQKPVYLIGVIVVKSKLEEMITLSVDTTDNCFLAGNYTILGSTEGSSC